MPFDLVASPPSEVLQSGRCGEGLLDMARTTARIATNVGGAGAGKWSRGDKKRRRGTTSALVYPARLLSFFLPGCPAGKQATAQTGRMPAPPPHSNGEIRLSLGPVAYPP